MSQAGVHDALLAPALGVPGHFCQALSGAIDQIPGGDVLRNLRTGGRRWTLEDLDWNQRLPRRIGGETRASTV